MLVRHMALVSPKVVWTVLHMTPGPVHRTISMAKSMVVLVLVIVWALMSLKMQRMVPIPIRRMLPPVAVQVWVLSVHLATSRRLEAQAVRRRALAYMLVHPLCYIPPPMKPQGP